MVDNIPNLKIIATGSSSFEISKEVGDPLTGRKHVFRLYPLSQTEISEMENYAETIANLELRMIFGSYPEIIGIKGVKDKELYLRELVSSYLFQDILELEGVRHSDKLLRLLQLLAFQIGKEVSINELGTQLGMSKNTVARYLDLLEKVFVIFHRRGFSANRRKEISKANRFYFCDNGIRNVLIGNFNPLSIRNDAGELWENYIISERMKKLEYEIKFIDSFFWRTYSQQEIDLIEVENGEPAAFEIKWNPKKLKIPSEWKASYPQADFAVIDKENYLKFIL